jgi:hypothetical protein
MDHMFETLPFLLCSAFSKLILIEWFSTANVAEHTNIDKTEDDKNGDTAGGKKHVSFSANNMNFHTGGK